MEAATKYAHMTMSWDDPRQFLNTVAAFTINVSALEKIEAGALEAPTPAKATKTKTVTAQEVLDKAPAPAPKEEPKKEEAPKEEAENYIAEGNKIKKKEEPKEEETTVTHDDVKKLVGALVKDDKKQECMAVFKSYGVKKLSEFEEAYPEPAKLAELYHKLEEVYV